METIQNCIFHALVMASTFIGANAQAEAPSAGYYQRSGPEGYATLTMVTSDKGVTFYYASESSSSSCAVPGLATLVSPGSDTFEFVNDKAHHLYERYEGYDLADVSECRIHLTFGADEVSVTTFPEHGCRGFCGIHGGIGGTLRLVRP